jgi:hypothetical protein
MTREAGLTEPVKDAASPEFFIGGLDALGMSVPVITYDIGEDGKRSTEPKVYGLVGWDVTAACASSRSGQFIEAPIVTAPRSSR